VIFQSNTSKLWTLYIFHYSSDLYDDYDDVEYDDYYDNYDDYDDDDNDDDDDTNSDLVRIA